MSSVICCYAFIAFNKEIKEFFGFAETNEIEDLNKKIANTLDLITSLQGNSVSRKSSREGVGKDIGVGIG